MADALFNVGNRLSAEDWLRLSSAVDGVRNERNSLLRGVSAIIPGVSVKQIADSGFSANLRRYSTANDEEITGKIIYGMSDKDFKNEKEYVREYKRRNYPPLFMEKALAEWRRTKGREESSAAEVRAVRDQEIQELELGQKQKLWPLNVESKELSVKSAKSEADKKRNEKYSERLASKIAMKAYDYYNQDMDRETALETAIEEERAQFKKGGIAGGYDSAWARSAYVKAREKFNKLTKDTGTTKPVYDTRNGEQRWMTEDDIQAINKAEGPETILPSSAEPPDEQQVGMAMLSAAGQVLYDEAVLKTAGIEAEEARIVLQQWASDKSWLSRFNEIPEHLRKLHQEWYRAYEGVMDRWYTTTTTGKVIGG
jgi:hypothetical protein